MYLSSMINSDIYKYDNENQAIEALRVQLLEQLAKDDQDINLYDITLTKVQHGMVMKGDRRWNN